MTPRLTPRQVDMARVLDMVESKPDAGCAMPKHDKMTAIALVCGPPTDAFRWDLQKSGDFQRLAGELFGLREPRDLRGLYALYENWYAGADLDRMLADRQAEKEALGAG